MFVHLLVYWMQMSKNIHVYIGGALTDYTPEARFCAARANRRRRDFEPAATHLLTFAITVQRWDGPSPHFLGFSISPVGKYTLPL